MNKKSMLETVVLSAVLVFIPLLASAALLENSKMIEGVIKAIADDTVTIVAQSVDGKQISEVNIHAKPETKYQDATLADLKEGDLIKVEYHDDHDLKAADTIKKIQQ